MSYSLIYDKQFVKLTDKLFIPMILAGDSNLWEHNGSSERRVRSWSNFSFVLNGAISGSLESMLEKMQKEEDTIEGCGLKINGSRATFGTYLGIAKTGCKKALTIEQLAEEGIYLNIHTYNSNDTTEALKEQGLEPVSFKPKSTEDMLDFIENIEPKYKENKGGTLYINYSGMYEGKPKRIRKKYFAKEQKEQKIVKSSLGYTIKIAGLGYLSSYRGGGFRYGYSEINGKQYIDKKEAEKIAKKMSKRRSDFEFTVVLVDYGYPITFYVPADKNITLPEAEPEVEMTDKELIASLELRPEGEEVANFFDSTQKCYLEPLGVALHDFIKGCEVTRTKPTLMQQAITLFRSKYPEEYYVLLD